MQIRELEKHTELERATIRFYEKEGFITPVRQENGYREYSEADRDTLLKIKLLRQLGMSLEMIRDLQQGSEDFSTALSDQIHALEHKLQDTERAKEVCLELRDSGATYENLDAAHYLRELTRVKPAQPTWTPQPVPEFRQLVPAHPWRRYFARVIDFSILEIIKILLLVVVFRIRPINDFVYTFFGFSIIMHLISIPIEGLLLHYWGTTPGKWIMGIRVESVNGGRLSIRDAMVRSWRVLWHGYGFTIPIYSLWRLYRSYKDYVDSRYVPWDEECGSEIQIQYYYLIKKKVIIAAMAVVYLFAYWLVWNDAVLPVHRGEDLTVAQIAANHNDLLELYYNDQTPPVSMYLNENGNWRTTSTHSTIIYVGNKPVNENDDYKYRIQDGYVRGISYRQEWTDIRYMMPVTSKIQITMISIVLAQDWARIGNLEDFEKGFNEAFIKYADGSFRYENLEIRWDTEAVNCLRDTQGRYFTPENNGESSLKLSFELIIHDTE